jgi:hypothetical protein
MGVDQIVADPSLMLEELGGDHRADGVAAEVLRPGGAAPVTVEAGDRVGAARFEFSPQYVALRPCQQYRSPGAPTAVQPPLVVDCRF